MKGYGQRITQSKEKEKLKHKREQILLPGVGNILSNIALTKSCCIIWQPVNIFKVIREKLSQSASMKTSL